MNLVTDAFSRKIIGYHLHKSLHAEGTIKALEMALKQKGDQPLSLSTIHHSDRGIQYCCHYYIRILKNNGITISMTNTPDPLENPLAERMHRTLKEEFKLERGFPTFEQAQEAVVRTIFIHNHKYPHGSLGYLTPNQVHNGKKPGKKKWKTYPKRKDPAAIEAMVAEKRNKRTYPQWSCFPWPNAPGVDPLHKIQGYWGREKWAINNQF